MAELTVDLVYGQALLEAARETGKEDIICEEGFQILEILKEEKELRKFIEYPGISSEEKKKALTGIFEEKICTELMNFLCILVDKRRTMRFEGIMKAYRNLLDREEGVAYGSVVSVEPLKEERIAQLEEQTSRLLHTNVKLTNEIDPGLIAGVKIFVEGKIIDASYRKKFDQMAVELSRN